MTPEAPIRVLLVEDNPGDARLIAETLRPMPFELRTVDRIGDVRHALAAFPADVLLMDLGLPDGQGLESFHRVKTIAPGLPIIVLTGLSDQDVAIRAVREGAQDYLVKGRQDGDSLPRTLRFAVERRRTDEALRRSEARFRAAIEASPDAFAILEAVRDASGRICTFILTDMNTRAEKLLGAPLEKLNGRPLEEWCPFDPSHDSVATFSRVVETREFLEQELASENPATGGVTWMLRQVFPLGDGVACFARDITARRQMEEHLRQTQKMEATGQLAAGVAHDIRNLITAIQGQIAHARRSLPEGHGALEPLEQIQAAATQAGGIAGSLLRFSLKSPTEKKAIRLGGIVEQAVGLLRHSLPASITVDVRLGDPAPFVNADVNQLQQVIMNLAINARDAMPGGGTLSISVGLTSEGGEVKPGPRGVARLVVRDTGVGMSSETLARIFEPYFTTKPRGQGTGLGLPIIHGIVSEHNGAISVESKPGAGTTFRIDFPAVDPPAVQAPTPAAARRMALLADPNPFVREVVASMLASLGFDVVQAADGAASLRLARSASRKLDLIVAAAALPDGSGTACIRQVREVTRSPEVPALLIAGALHNGNGEARDHLGFLPYPFRRADLAREIERLQIMPR